ncbi:unnamed protein product [Penicillium salamii]|nr:unnamed protein product [Penicillium salamii]
MIDYQMFNDRLQITLDKRRDEGSLLIPPSPAKESLVDFGSNDTLSLSSSRLLSKEYLEELARNPDFTIAGKGGRLGGGPTQYQAELEEMIAQVHGAECATYFNSGYDANVAIWSSLPQKGDVVIHDVRSHASTWDGLRLGRASARIPFTHNSCESFRECVKSALNRFPDIAAGKSIIFFAVESFYSMDGDVVPIHRLILSAEELLPRKNFVFVIDEAHSNGVIGPNGSGFISFYGLDTEIAIRVHTFGKAPGVNGGMLSISAKHTAQINISIAVILSNKTVKLTILNLARNMLFSVGPNFPVLAAIKASYNLITSEEGEKRREVLQRNITYLYNHLENQPQWEAILRLEILRVPILRGWEMRPFQTPIVTVYTQKGQSKPLSIELRGRGYSVQQGGHPFIPRGLEGIRIMVHAGNNENEIQGLVEGIMAWSDTRATAMAAAPLSSKL